MPRTLTDVCMGLFAHRYSLIPSGHQLSMKFIQI